MSGYDKYCLRCERPRRERKSRRWRLHSVSHYRRLQEKKLCVAADSTVTTISALSGCYSVRPESAGVRSDREVSCPYLEQVAPFDRLKVRGKTLYSHEVLFSFPFLSTTQ